MQWKKFSVSEGTNAGVSARNFEPSAMEAAKVRLLDDAKTWKYIGWPAPTTIPRRICWKEITMYPAFTLRGLLRAAVAVLATACATPPSGGDPGHKGFSL